LELKKENDQLSQLESRDPAIKSLEELRLHGEKLGLLDGRCPLCGSEVSEEEYISHLQEIEDRVKAASASITSVISQRNKIINELDKIDKQIEMLQAQHSEKVNAKSKIEKSYRNVISHSGIEGLSVDKDIQSNLKILGENTESSRISLSKLEEAIAILEASRVFESVVQLENELRMAREEADEVSERITLLVDIQDKVKSAQNTIQRISGEIVDEQLSEMSPLLSEIFIRLRPHIDWKEVNYRLRGDVRRFLSLNVGDNLNPSFLFSSGQRRTLGLAFLITIHLARSWSKLNTLILDDPVQHIDDYRALHLTEVLAALRKQKRQIICTVEDKALANLLCRRLRSLIGEEGALVNLEYAPGLGVTVKSMESIKPLQEAILKAS
jgi:wobble nucleotide-excising tRNase